MHQGTEHKGVMRLLPNYFKTLGEGPARGMERGEKDAHEVSLSLSLSLSLFLRQLLLSATM